MTSQDPLLTSVRIGYRLRPMLMSGLFVALGASKAKADDLPTSTGVTVDWTDVIQNANASGGEFNIFGGTMPNGDSVVVKELAEGVTETVEDFSHFARRLEGCGMGVKYHGWEAHMFPDGTLRNILVQERVNGLSSIHSTKEAVWDAITASSNCDSGAFVYGDLWPNMESLQSNPNKAVIVDLGTMFNTEHNAAVDALIEYRDTHLSIGNLPDNIPNLTHDDLDELRQRIDNIVGTSDGATCMDPVVSSRTGRTIHVLKTGGKVIGVSMLILEVANGAYYGWKFEGSAGAKVVAAANMATEIPFASTVANAVDSWINGNSATHEVGATLESIHSGLEWFIGAMDNGNNPADTLKRHTERLDEAHTDLAQFDSGNFFTVDTGIFGQFCKKRYFYNVQAGNTVLHQEADLVWDSTWNGYRTENLRELTAGEARDRLEDRIQWFEELVENELEELLPDGTCTDFSEEDYDGDFEIVEEDYDDEFDEF